MQTAQLTSSAAPTSNNIAELVISEDDAKNESNNSQ